ncbi:MAG: Tex family protein [Chthoniobacterales bacterium]
MTDTASASLENIRPFVSILTAELPFSEKQILATALLLEEGATVPFISRYRKEVTGSLDEVAVTSIRDRLSQLKEVHARRSSILKSLTERKLLTDELKEKLTAATTLTKLEDIYLPFRPKRRTKATIATERGLAPLAEILREQNPATDPLQEAAAFIDPKKEVPTADDALAGARDILAEHISDDAQARASLRTLFWSDAEITSKVLTGKETEGAKFKDYFDWKEPIKNAPSHRVLAMRRGETEGFLLVRVQPPEDRAQSILHDIFVKGDNPASQQVALAAEDSFKRLLKFSMEGETRLALKKKADEEAIRVFTENLRELLLASPLGQKRVMAIDPGFRTGCKTVCLDAQGKLLHHDVIYPETGRAAEAATKIKAMLTQYQIDAIAIGNGTAGRETELFVRGIGLPAKISIVMVNESGASIYSASEVAREEFPDHDLTVRGAVSIGRRLMDPLAELVKLDPKSIGVGQYQHDVDQNLLKHALDDTVISCVNGVGVELNTASAQLLSYVSGLNTTIATNIVSYRNENGPFSSRNDLSKVPRLGPKAYEQAAGFLRIRSAKNPLDASAVHPERYDTVRQMATDLSCEIPDLITDDSRRQQIKRNLDRYVSGDLGLPTLQDILAELARPGRDPRAQFEVFSFADEVSKPTDLKPGMHLPGIVTNVTAFGAFIDVGVHQDGLAHISQLSDEFVKDPSDVVRVGQKVQATVVEVDLDRKRIALSLKTNPDLAAPRGAKSSGNGNRPFSKPKNRAERRAALQGKKSNSPASNSGAAGNDWFSQAMAKAKNEK